RSGPAGRSGRRAARLTWWCRPGARPMTLPRDVAGLLSPHALAGRRVDLGVLIAGIDALEFLVASGYDPERLTRVVRGDHACDRALRILLKVRRHVLARRVTWDAVRRHLLDQLRH